MGRWGRAAKDTLLLLDSQIGVNLPQGHVILLPLRREANPKRAALAAIAAWLEKKPLLPAEAWEAVLALESRTERQDSAAALDIGRRLATRMPGFRLQLSKPWHLNTRNLTTCNERVLNKYYLHDGVKR